MLTRFHTPEYESYTIIVLCRFTFTFHLWGRSITSFTTGHPNTLPKVVGFFRILQFHPVFTHFICVYLSQFEASASLTRVKTEDRVTTWGLVTSARAQSVSKEAHAKVCVYLGVHILLCDINITLSDVPYRC